MSFVYFGMNRSWEEIQNLAICGEIIRKEVSSIIYHSIPPFLGGPSTELLRTVLQVRSAVGSIRRLIVHGRSPRGIDCCLYRGRGCEQVDPRLEPHSTHTILHIARIFVETNRCIGWLRRHYGGPEGLPGTLPNFMYLSNTPDPSEFIAEASHGPTSSPGRIA